MTLIEVALALALGLTVVSFAVGLYMVVSSDQKTAQAQQNINMIRANVRQLYSERSSYAGMKEQTLIEAQVVPQAMVVTPSTLQNNWGGSVEVNPVAGNPSQFKIIYEEVPQGACLDIASAEDDDWTDLIVDGVSVDGTVTEASANCDADNRVQLQGY